MTIEDLNKIDLIGYNENESYTSLTISDHLEWDEQNEKLVVLQEKINNYLMFIESGQLFEQHPQAKGSEIRICLCCMHAPSEEGLKFISLITPIIEEAGFEFEWEIIGDN